MTKTGGVKRRKKTLTKGQRAKKKKPPKKTGIPFELRARDAMQFLHPEHVVKHNEKLEMVYQRPRQFDVTRRTLVGVLVQTVEAKDHGRRVPFGIVTAFETDNAELAVVPAQRPALISARGFQEGPIERKKHLGDKAGVAELYQLREVQDRDWEGGIKGMRIGAMARQLGANDVRVLLDPSKKLPTEVPRFVADRATSFLFDATGQIVGNLLDAVNQLLRSMAGNESGVGKSLDVPLPPDAHLRVVGDLFRVVSVSLVPTVKTIDTKIDADLSTGARDTLIDCVSGRKWIIPDPGKAIKASKTGFDVALTYEHGGTLDLDVLGAVPPSVPDEDHALAEFMSALQLQLMLRALRAGSEQDDEGAHPELREGLAAAGTSLNEGKLDESARIYWETCQTATSLVALVNLAAIYQRQGKLNEALQLALRTIELFPLEVHGFANVALLLMDLRRTAEAGEAIRAGKALHAGHPELMKAEARWLLGEKQWARGATTFAHLVTMNAADGPSRLGLAICEWQQGLREEAAFDAAEAAMGLSIAAQGSTVLRMLMPMGRWARAATIGRELLRRVEVTDPDRQELQLLTAMSSYEAGDKTTARALGAELTISDPHLTYLNALLAYSEDRVEEALAGFRAYCVERPDDAAGSRNIAVCLSDLGRFPEAHEALKQAAPNGDTNDGTYWATRAVAAARAGDLPDTVASADRAAGLGVDAAAMLMSASQVVIAAGSFERGVELRQLASKYPTQNGTVLAERIIERIWEIAWGKAPDEGSALDARLSDAELKGADAARIAFARMFVAIVRSDGTALEALSGRVREVVPQGLRGVLAVEALLRHRAGLALDLLGDGPDLPLPTQGPIRYPHTVALRALALMYFGRVEEAIGLEQALATLPAHPFHRKAMAYIAYARGEVSKCLSFLDEADRLLGSGQRTDVALRTQALAEGALYDQLGEVLKSLFPNHPLVPRLPEWAQRNPIPPGKLNEFLERDARLVAALGTAARQRPEGAEHVVIARRDDKWAPLISFAREWEPAFVEVARLVPDGTPFLLRATKRPVGTIQRLLGPRAD